MSVGRRIAPISSHSNTPHQAGRAATTSTGRCMVRRARRSVFLRSSVSRLPGSWTINRASSKSAGKAVSRNKTCPRFAHAPAGVRDYSSTPFPATRFARNEGDLLNAIGRRTPGERPRRAVWQHPGRSVAAGTRRAIRRHRTPHHPRPSADRPAGSPPRHPRPTRPQHPSPQTCGADAPSRPAGGSTARTTTPARNQIRAFPRPPRQSADPGPASRLGFTHNLEKV